MANKIVICVFMLAFYECNSYNAAPSLLDGIFSGAQTIGSKVNEVISGLAQGEVNLNFQGHVNHNPAYHHPHGHYGPKPPGPPRPAPPEEQTETIVVVVEEEQPSPGNQQPPRHQEYGPPGYNYYNNYYRPDFVNKPGYGGHNNYYNYQPHGNHRPAHHHHKPGYNYNPHGQGNQYNNGNHYGYNNGNGNPHKYGPNNYNNPPHNQNDNYNGNYHRPGYGDQNSYTSSTTKPNEPAKYQPEPTIETTKAPEKNPDYGNHDPSEEPGADKKPNYSDYEHSTKKPGKDDAPLFVPLNPNQYTYGGDKIEINAPKRETSEDTKPADPKPAEDDEAYPIDIRLGDRSNL